MPAKRSFGMVTVSPRNRAFLLPLARKRASSSREAGEGRPLTAMASGDPIGNLYRFIAHKAIDKPENRWQAAAIHRDRLRDRPYDAGATWMGRA